VVVSGQEIPIEISLFNAEGEVSKDDSSSVAILRFESVPEYGRLNGNQVIATNGVFNFTSFQVTMQPGESAALKLSIMNLDTYGNTVSFVDTPVRIEIYARPCTQGEMLTPDRRCEPCSEG